MKTLETILTKDYIVIKPITKETTEELKEYHYKANTLLYNYRYIPLNIYATDYIIKNLIEIGKIIKSLQIDKPKPKEKQEEILKILRTIITKLKEYKASDDIKHTTNEIIKIMNFRIHNYLANIKNNDITTEDKLSLLKQNKLIYNLYSLQLVDERQTYKKMQQELIESITNEFIL